MDLVASAFISQYTCYSSSPKFRVITGHVLLSPSISCKRRSVRFRLRAEQTDEQVQTEAVQLCREIPIRTDFPADFIFGSSTSAYQIEGAWNQDGKGPSIWDHFCHDYPDWIEDRSNGDVAVDSYNRYKEDIQLLKDMGMQAYRFSISWSRILPKGTRKGGVNLLGIDYYTKLIDALIENGITPFVTLFHWDTPQALHDAYGGFLDPRIVEDYTDFAKVCFEYFGSKVKHWLTFNEPYVYPTYGYGLGQLAPGRASPGQKCAVPFGNSLTEPYIVGHNMLLAHAEAVELYKNNYQGNDGHIGMALVSFGYEPFDRTSYVDHQARERAIDHHLGWFLEPMFRGDYPFSMRSLVRDRLPYFTDDEKKKLKGSYNMVGLNYYTAMFCKNIDISPNFSPTVNKNDDAYIETSMVGPDGKLIGPNTGDPELNSYPKGLKELLLIIKERYGNPPVYITENGIADISDGSKLYMKYALEDTKRLTYLQDHISAVKEAMNLGANVKGHFTWSLLDNFEWSRGYGPRFGLVYVDRNDNFRRVMKKSAKWFSQFNAGYGAIAAADTSNKKKTAETTAADTNKEKTGTTNVLQTDLVSSAA